MAAKKLKLLVGRSYRISFMDPRQAIYTWFTGEATFMREDKEDYNTSEQHYYFMVDEQGCSFPQSAVGQIIRR